MSECFLITNVQSNFTQDPVNQSSNTQDLANQSINNQKPKPKLSPPVIIPASAWRKVSPKVITTTPDEAIEVKAFHNYWVKIQGFDVDTYRITQKYLRITKTDSHIYPKPEKRKLKIVVNGLTSGVSEIKLIEELKSRGYEVIFVRQFIIEGRMLLIHIVTPLSLSENEAIFNERHIIYISVILPNFIIEPYRN